MKTEMNHIEVNITRARITGVHFKFSNSEEILPEVVVELALLTQSGRIVTSLSLSTESWYSDGSKLNKDDMPAHVFSAIGTAVRELSTLCVRKINSINQALPAPGVEV